MRCGIHVRRQWVRWVALDGSSVWLGGGYSGPVSMRTRVIHVEGHPNVSELVQWTDRSSHHHPAFLPLEEERAPTTQRDRFRSKFGRMIQGSVVEVSKEEVKKGRWIPTLSLS